MSYPRFRLRKFKALSAQAQFNHGLAWPKDAPSLFKQLQGQDGPVSVLPHMATLNMDRQSHLRQPNIDPIKFAQDINQICKALPSKISRRRFADVYNYFSCRFWAPLEDITLYKALKPSGFDEAPLSRFLLFIISQSPHLVAVSNALRLFKHLTAPIEGELLLALGQQRQLTHLVFDLIKRSDLTSKQSLDLAFSQIYSLSGWQVMQTLDALPDVLTPAQEERILSIPINNLAPFKYSFEERTPDILAVLYRGKLLDVLKRGQPCDAVMLNLLDAYLEILDVLLYSDEGEFEAEEALEAFPIFVNYLSTLNLDLPQLSMLQMLIRYSFDDCEMVLDDEFPYFTPAIEAARSKLFAIAHKDEHRKTIMSKLASDDTRYLSDAIDFAVTFYGMDQFELYFKAAQLEPGQYFDLESWYEDTRPANRTRFLDWAADVIKPDALLAVITDEKTITLSQAKQKILTAVLDSQQDAPEHIIPFIRLGLRLENPTNISALLHHLENLSLHSWPDDSYHSLLRLYEKTSDNWNSWLKKEKRFIKLKDRIGALIKLYEHNNVAGN